MWVWLDYGAARNTPATYNYYFTTYNYSTIFGKASRKKKKKKRLGLWAAAAGFGLCVLGMNGGCAREGTMEAMDPMRQGVEVHCRV